ncbi:Uncharacterised protein g1864 [Pycnogonum litorale]
MLRVLVLYQPKFLTPNVGAYNHISRWDTFVGMLLAFLSAICSAFYNVIARFITKTHPMVVFLYEAMIQVTVVTIVVLASENIRFPENTLEWIFTSVAAISYSFSIVIGTTAFHHGNVSYVALSIMMFLPTSIVLKSVIEQELPTYFDFISITCILISVVIILFEDRVKSIFQRYVNPCSENSVTQDEELGPLNR